jgi:ABC-type uncharacterized transport system ATPase subunit
MNLELRHIRKRFGPTVANDDVSLRVEPGSIHAVLGENGAGKSTLMKVLSGFLTADSGEVILDGKPLHLGSPRRAVRAGIGMLHQDPLVFLPFSARDTALLGSGRSDRGSAEAELAEMGRRFGFGFAPDAPARRLSVGERQQLEILRLLWLGVRVLILDEPTTGISAVQRDALFGALRSLAAEGWSVLFISHKLDEVAELCDRVTVLRLGRVVGDAELPCPEELLVEMMFGRELERQVREVVPPGDEVLEVEELVVEEGPLSVGPISIDGRSGEALGLAGLEGSGQRLFLRACAGLVRPVAGRIRVQGSELAPWQTPPGVHYMPAGRLEEGLFPGLTVTEHLELAGMGQGLVVDWAAAGQRAQRSIGHYRIKGGPDSPVESLSGGNQQRLLVAMAPPDARLLLLEQPTRGLDLESAQWIWSQLDQARANGALVVFASSDLDELLAQADRIAVFFAGRLLAVLDSDRTTVSELGHLIGGRVAG